MVARIGARINIPYSQSILSLERQWAQIFAPHNDGILPDHLHFLVLNKVHESSPSHSRPKSLITQFPWGRNIFSRIWLTDPGSWSFITLSLWSVFIIALMFSNPPLLQLIRWVSPNLFSFFQPPVILQLSSTPLNHSSSLFHLILFSPQTLSCKMF